MPRSPGWSGWRPEDTAMIADLNPLHYFTTPWFWSSFIGWTLAQSIKMTVGFVRTRKIDFRYLLSTGGMPSAHSAMVCGLCTSVGLTEGFDSPVAALALGIAAITMFDATNVRRAAGHQARVLNVMIEELFKEHKLRHTRLKELLGHTRKEVFAGMLVGIAVALLVVHFWPAA
ncbi:MAG: divergent PAP2 family protein [Kiritimatiellae bacterium]|jgi:acid phosphatase family membrane protein YuiD|nr:divergent PAP2 family protein [Kiritimatiellia bacterium]MDD3584087.1 divergent PAP2 family protein [Kiritimatiellia bacterium]